MNANNPALDRAIEIMIDSYKNGGKLLVCGNGGSASDSAHIVGELVKGFLKKRPLPADWDEAMDHLPLQMGLNAIDLTAQGAVIAAVVNDLGGELMYAQQVMAYANPGDVIIGITTSGNARNVLLALRAAKLKGATGIGLTGNKIERLGNISRRNRQRLQRQPRVYASNGIAGFKRRKQRTLAGRKLA